MALDSLVLFTDGLEVGVGGEIGGSGCKSRAYGCFSQQCYVLRLLLFKDSGS